MVLMVSGLSRFFPICFPADFGVFFFFVFFCCLGASRLGEKEGPVPE